MHNGQFDEKIKPLKKKTSFSPRDTIEDEEAYRHHITRDPGELITEKRIEARECNRQELAGLSELIIQGTRDFRVHVRYVENPSPSRSNNLPPGLERVLQETMDQENMDEGMRKSALHDEAARKALMMLHLENTV